MKSLSKYCLIRTLPLFIFLLKIDCGSYAQNLIRNWSFEEVTICKDNDTLCIQQLQDYDVLEDTLINNISYPTCFISVLMKSYLQGYIFITPDLYCSGFKHDLQNYSGFFSVPKNIMGYQNPIKDSSYAGIGLYGAYEDGSPVYSKEFIGQRLKNQLEKKREYCVSFKVSLAENSTYLVSNLGFAFSENSCDLRVDNNAPNQYFHNLYDSLGVIDIGNKFITDTANWTTLSFKYKATGNEVDFMIGNFKADNELIRQKTNFSLGTSDPFPGYSSYYYIDDISLTPPNSRQRRPRYHYMPWR